MFLGPTSFLGKIYPGICWKKIADWLKVCTIFQHPGVTIEFKKTTPVYEFFHQSITNLLIKDSVNREIKHKEIIMDVKETKPLQEIVKPKINLSFPRPPVTIKFDRVRKCR